MRRRLWRATLVAAMQSASRAGIRPPQMNRLPRNLPLSRACGPASATAHVLLAGGQVPEKRPVYVPLGGWIGAHPGVDRVRFGQRPLSPGKRAQAPAGSGMQRSNRRERDAAPGQTSLHPAPVPACSRPRGCTLHPGPTNNSDRAKSRPCSTRSRTTRYLTASRPALVKARRTSTRGGMKCTFHTSINIPAGGIESAERSEATPNRTRPAGARTGGRLWAGATA